MADSPQRSEKEGQSLEDFLYFIVFTIAVSFIPWINSTVEIVWIRVIIGLLYVVILLRVVKVLTNYGIKHGFNRKYRFFPHYMIYIVIYLVFKYWLIE
ncbi:hypothetical protein ANABIO32_36330 [Rossellomorea marisflavi]|uniref:hypothetical protein n=1 Tax=Rossellomorea marisflavi TaxID=189381 RepID=UPI0025C96B32|nr:hypothetical protein [Rossellomorea marisflavi]GLI85875.1 hypothetical protein ANABIO32_36330 [Rossellomorea marisflavi]